MDGSLVSTAVEEYRARKRTHKHHVEALQRLHVRLGYVRLLLAGLVVAAAWASLERHMLAAWWIAAPLACFGGIAMYHTRVLRGQARTLRAAGIYERGLARMDDRWAGLNPRESQAAAGTSLYAADLDVTGRDGLYELLCTARTAMGEETLLGWLLSPAPVREILERQAAIAEICGRLDLLEAAATAGPEVTAKIDTASLVRWAETESPAERRMLPWIALLPAAAAIWGAVYWLRAGDVAPLLATLCVEGVALRLCRGRLRRAFDGLEHAFKNLQLLSALMRCVEETRFEASWLVRVQAKLTAGQCSGSAAIGQLGTLALLSESLHNPLLRKLDLPLLYSVQLAFAIERWRRRHGGSVRLWLEGVGEMEALFSLATYSFEHPEDPFPVFAEGAPCFEAEALGHPLLAAAACVRNDVQICGTTRVLLISGSNMSGKSTLMRAMGVNVVLAMCGAPVRARRLHLTPLRLGASLLVNDSLQSGSSRFYAEIKRLGQICELAEDRSGAPVLFLLDELLQGTNSKDRLAGAEGVMRALVQAGAIGVITTHDLSLTEMRDADELGLTTMHFQDEIVGGRMRFDYTLRDGVVTKSNGLALMRLIGLKV